MRFFRVFILLFILLFSQQNLFAAKAPWPMFRQNCRNTGCTNTNIIGVQGNPKIKWKCNIEDRNWSTGPVISPDNSIVYISTWDHNANNPLPHYYGKILAIATTNNSTNATYIYSADSPYLIGEFLSMDKSGNIYIADQQSSADGYSHGVLYSLKRNGASFSISNILFANRFAAGGPLIGSDGTLYIGNANGCFYAITSGVTNSLISTGNSSESWVVPAMGPDGTIYTGSIRTTNIYAITNGSIKWIHKYGNVPSSPLTVDNSGNIYFGCGDGTLISIKSDGSINWIKSIGSGSIDSTPAIYNGVVYFGCNDNKFYAVYAASGNLKWTFSAAGGPVRSSPLVASDGTIYFGCNDKNIYAIMTNGQLKWNLTLYMTNNGCSPIIGNDGTLYISDGVSYNSGNLYAIIQGPTPPPTWKALWGASSTSVALTWSNSGNITSQTLYRSSSTGTNASVDKKYILSGSVSSFTDAIGLSKDTFYYYRIKTYFNGKTSSFSSVGSAKTWKFTKAPWPMFKQNNRHTGCTNTNVIGVQGNPVQKWYYQAAPGGPDGPHFYGSPSIDANNTVYIGIVGGDKHVYAITNGINKWAATSGGDIQESDSTPTISPDGYIYVGSRNPDNSGQGQIYILSASDGSEKNHFDTGSTSCNVSASAVIGPDGTVYIGSINQKLYVITNFAFQKTIDIAEAGIGSSAAIGADGTIFFGDINGHFFTLKPSGNITIKTLSGAVSNPVIANDGTVYVCGGTNLYAFNSDGSWKWPSPVNGISCSPAVGPGGIIYCSIRSNLYALNQNGSVLWTCKMDNFISSAPTIGADSTVYVAGNTNLYAIKNGTVEWKFNTGYIPGSCPSIGPDGTIYVGTVSGKVWALGEGAIKPIIESHAIATNKISVSWSVVNGIHNTTSFTLFCSTNNSLSSITNTTSKIRGFSTSEYNFTITNLKKAKMYYYLLRAYSAIAPSPVSGAVISNRTFADKPYPPTLSTPDLLSSSELRIAWQPMANVSSWSLFRNTTQSTSSNLISFDSFSSNTTNFLNAGLNPNTRYYYCMKAINAMGSSGFSALVNNITLAGPASLTFNPAPLVCDGVVSNFIVTNKNLIGSRTVKGYFYTWDMKTNTPASYAKSWTNGIAQGSFRTNVATNDGDWYLHVVSVNSNGLTSFPKIFGPFYSYSQIVKGIRLKTDQAQINNDGTFATISTAAPISNSIYPFSAITTTNIFYIKVLEGICNISCSGTNNGLSYVRSNPSNLSFKVSGDVINKIQLLVYWKADSSKSCLVTLLISPPMELDKEHPSVAYKNILNPDKNDKLNIYIMAQQDERVEVKIYDIMERRLVYETVTSQGTMRNVEWDMVLRNGHKLPDKLYGILVKGQSWTREMKFVVKRK